MSVAVFISESGANSFGKRMLEKFPKEYVGFMVSLALPTGYKLRLFDTERRSILVTDEMTELENGT